MTEKIGVIGAGIVGLAVARELASTRGAEVTVLEKEDRVGAHQTGHNSGVVHAGIYYPPGSLKARLCREGVALLKEYCAQHHLPYEEVGKLVVACTSAERPRLAALAERARANGVPGITELDALGLREIEPHAVGVGAVHSPHTAIADFPAVARRLALDVAELGGSVRLAHPVKAIRESAGSVEVLAAGRRFAFDRLVICAGLGTDAVARMAGRPGDIRIVPFRGEYYALDGAARDLVRGLIYPVPDPRYPFLGVHLTRHIDGEVLVGPNAVLALAYEGYRGYNLVIPGGFCAGRARCAWPGGTGVPGSRRCTARWSRGPSSGPRAATCPSSPPPTCGEPRVGYAPRPWPRTAGWSTTSPSTWTAGSFWCATRRPPRRPPVWRLLGTSPVNCTSTRSVRASLEMMEARLLIVDDEPNILELLAASLRFAGFDVCTAKSGLGRRRRRPTAPSRPGRPRRHAARHGRFRRSYGGCAARARTRPWSS